MILSEFCAGTGYRRKYATRIASRAGTRQRDCPAGARLDLRNVAVRSVGSRFERRIGVYQLAYECMLRAAGHSFDARTTVQKDDNAPVEQKHWTHVRMLLGWERYDTREALARISDLYGHELELRW